MVLEELFKDADERIDRGQPDEIREFIESDLEFLLEEYKENITYLCGLYYIKANHLSQLRSIMMVAQEDLDSSEINHLEENIIYSFRLALKYGTNSGNELGTNSEFLAMILTNLANELDNVGRFVEAIDLWKRTESVLGTSFPMADGNMGLGYLKYASFVYDEGHGHLLRQTAYHRLSYALENPEHLHSEYAINIFKESKNHLEEFYHPDFLAHVHEYENPTYSSEELNYRKWCLENTLFLNPLNDIANDWGADRDIFGLPSIVVPIGEHYPIYHSYFNQLKQEFVSARWFLYDSLFQEPHFSDKQTAIYNTLDYQTSSLSTQKLKVAYRCTYSIFDKIGYFLYKYFNITELEERAVSFKAVWYKNIRANKLQIRDQINLESNLPLKGLFWLSKDFFYKGELEYRDVMEPESKNLDVLRNHLEHKFLSVYDDAFGYREHLDINELNRIDLQEKTLSILKLARAAIIYLSLGIHRNEEIQNGKSDNRPLAHLTIDNLEDDWKR